MMAEAILSNRSLICLLRPAAFSARPRTDELPSLSSRFVS